MQTKAHRPSDQLVRCPYRCDAWLRHPARFDQRARGLGLRVLPRLGQHRPVAVRAGHAADGDVLPVWQGAGPRPYLAAITRPGQIRLCLPAECVPGYVRTRYELHVDVASRVVPVTRRRSLDRRSMVGLRICRRSRATRDHAECSQASGQSRPESFHINLGAGSGGPRK
jgi:hypothetical protein